MLFKRRGTPEWALFFGDAEWREFESLVRAEITPRGISGDIRTGELRRGKGTFGLANLAKTCHGAPPEDWQPLIRRHFALTEDVPDAFTGTPKVQLMHSELLHARGAERAFQKLTEDLALVLSWDLPDLVATPTLEEVLRHGEPEALFAAAIENTRAEPGLELTRHELPAGEETVELFALHGDSFFTAAHVLWAEDFSPPASPYGVIAAVPNRHSVLVHPIRGMALIGALGPLLDLARRMEQDGPGSISPDLHWVREGAFERLELTIDDHGVRFTPSPAFAEMLETLVRSD